jgi:hypothetical protein
MSAIQFLWRDIAKTRFITTLQPLTVTKIQTAKTRASSEIRGELKQKPTYNEEEAKHDSEPDPSDRNRVTLPKARQKRTKPLKGRDQDQWNGQYAVGTSGEKKKKKTELDLNSSTMCSVRAHEIIRDTMSPESVSVDGSEQFNRTSNCQP